MADKRLGKFTITAVGEEFRIHIESDGGDKVEMLATYDQLDILADQIEELLDEEEEVLEVEEADKD